MILTKHVFELLLVFLYKMGEEKALKEMQKVYLKYFDSENAEFEILWRN